VLREATEWPSGNHSTGWWARHRSLRRFRRSAAQTSPPQWSRTEDCAILTWKKRGSFGRGQPKEEEAEVDPRSWLAL